MKEASTSLEISEVLELCDDLTLASTWIHAAWAAGEGETLAETERWCAAVARNPAEALFVARAAGETVGCGALVRSDLPPRQALGPWGACLYVRPEYRGRRVGAALMFRIRDAARARGHEWLHLWTDSEALVVTYQRRGFVELERLAYAGRPIVVLRAHIDALREWR